MKTFALALLAASVTVVAWRWGSYVAGGSDSYCYVAQAQRWAGVIANPVAAATGGQPGLQVPNPLALEAPWPNAGAAFAPVGHVASPTVAGAAAPVCPSGLSIFMAPFVAVAGASAAFAAMPLFGIMLVLATYSVGARFGARIGVASAALIAASPVFLYQVIQPMSDVPAAALWMTAVAAATGTGPRQALWAGLATSAAVMVRPNLLPLGVGIGIYLLLRPERSWRQRTAAASAYALASIPGCLGVAAVQQHFFGSPLASGYGALDVLFSAGHILPNLRRYSTWLVQTHTPLIVLAALAPAILPGSLTLLFLGLFAINLGLYLPYVEFDDWSFLRFLLPTVPLLLISMIAVIDALLRRWMRLRNTKLALVASVAALAIVFVQAAAERQTFRLRRLEARFERAGLYVRDRLPSNAIVLTAWHSGSVRFYGRRPTLVWTELDAGALDAALGFLRERGFTPYLLFERWEEPLFRQRFTSSALGALDWPPAAEISTQVRLYRPEDRAQYLAGSIGPTEYVR